MQLTGQGFWILQKKRVLSSWRNERSYVVQYNFYDTVEAAMPEKWLKN